MAGRVKPAKIALSCDFSITRALRRELGCLDGSDEYGAGTLNFLQASRLSFRKLIKASQKLFFQDQLKTVLADKISNEAADSSMHDKLLEIFIGTLCKIFLVAILIFIDSSNLLSDENLNSAITKVYAAMSDTRQLMVHIEHLWIGHVVSIVYVLKGSSQILC